MPNPAVVENKQTSNKRLIHVKARGGLLVSLTQLLLSEQLEKAPVS
jgi:hypothetical protein